MDLARNVLIAVFIPLVLSLASTGCGRSGPPRGDVSGKVTFKKEPVSEGTIAFNDAGTGYGGTGELKSDGSFVIKTLEGGVPVGDYKVSVTPLTFMYTADPKKEPPGPKDKDAPNIPMKYRNPTTTTLTATVKEGRNAFEFDMVP